MSFTPPDDTISDPGLSVPPSVNSTFKAANAEIIVSTVLTVVVVIAVIVLCIWCVKKKGKSSVSLNANIGSSTPALNPYNRNTNNESFAVVQMPYATIEDSTFKSTTVHRFLNKMAMQKFNKFSVEEITHFTRNKAVKLGSGGFGTVYKGELPDGTVIAVKVLFQRVKEQFMAEIESIGRTAHINLVKLYGFCYDPTMTALVYEYMENGSLDRYLFRKSQQNLEWRKLHEIAIGVAKGIRYLHEECKPRIIHYDIKSENILLDSDLCPKVADFGLAELCEWENTHVDMLFFKGTRGYAAPEVNMPAPYGPYPVTYKCDVYSFGIVLFEIVGRRRHFSEEPSESKEWFPRWVWEKFEVGRIGEVLSKCGMEEAEDRVKAEKMCKVALLCIQHPPAARPPMGKVVMMLEGVMEIPSPGDPWDYNNLYGSAAEQWDESTTESTTDRESSSRRNQYTPIMSKYGIELATTTTSTSQG